MIEDAAGEDDFFAHVAADTINAFYKFREGIGIPDKEFLWKELGDNTLSISVRLGHFYGMGWWGTVPFMRESVITDEFLEKMYESTLVQIDFMVEHMTSAGNWRMSQLSCLMFMGYIFENEEWLRFGVKGLNEAFHNQVDECGSHEEHTWSYHNWMAKEFTSFFYLSAGLPELGLTIDSDKLIRMWEYSILAACPDGHPAGLNDSLRWGYARLDEYREKYENTIASYQRLIEKFTDRQYRDIRNDSRFFKEAGQWFVRSDESGDIQMLVFDGTIYGGGHCHKAVNSVSFYCGGRMLLTDPGTFNYERSDPFCQYGRDTNSHNTVVMDGLSQQKSSLIESASDIEGKCTFIHNSYCGGYTDGERSTTGIHERLVVWYKGKFCMINDSMAGSGKEFTANFNFFPSNHSFDGKTFATGFGDTDIMIKPIYSNVPIKQVVYEESMEPMAGWLAKDGSKLKGAEPGCAMQVSGKMKDNGTVVSYILMPFKNGEIPDVKMHNHDELASDEIQDEKSRIYNKPVKYSIEADRIRYDIITGYSKNRDSRLHLPIGKTGRYESDGKLAVVEFKDGKPVFAYVYDGSYLMYDEKLLFEEKEFGNYEKTL